MCENCKKAWEAYEKEIAPAGEAYDKAKATAEEAYDKTIANCKDKKCPHCGGKIG